MSSKPEPEQSRRAPPQGLGMCSIRCGRCGVVFRTRDCRKLDHFSIYRVVCPHCRWPGRYLASELHNLGTSAAKAKPPA